MPTSQNAEKNASAGPKEPTRKADAEGAAADSTPAASAMAEVEQTVQQQNNRRAPPTQAPLSAADEIQAQVTEWASALGWKGALFGFFLVYAFVKSFFFADGWLNLLPGSAPSKIQIPADSSVNPVVIGCALLAVMLFTYIACALVQEKTRSRKDSEEKFFRNMMGGSVLAVVAIFLSFTLWGREKEVPVAQAPSSSSFLTDAKTWAVGVPAVGLAGFAGLTAFKRKRCRRRRAHKHRSHHQKHSSHKKSHQ